MTLRSRRLLDLAHEMDRCTLEIPDVCIGTSPAGCEPCHGPKSILGGGMGHKPDDIFAAGCHPCHVEVDQGKRLSRDDRQFYLLRGIARTWAELMRAERLKVA